MRNACADPQLYSPIYNFFIADLNYFEGVVTHSIGCFSIRFNSELMCFPDLLSVFSCFRSELWRESSVWNIAARGKRIRYGVYASWITCRINAFVWFVSLRLIFSCIKVFFLHEQKHVTQCSAFSRKTKGWHVCVREVLNPAAVLCWRILLQLLLLRWGPCDWAW